MSEEPLRVFQEKMQAATNYIHDRVRLTISRRAKSTKGRAKPEEKHCAV